MTDKEWLHRAIDLARRNVAEGGGPFGAVLVQDGNPLAEGVNRVTQDCDPTAHAEIEAIRAACRSAGRFDLAGTTIYASCEPCPMCLAAAYWARVGRVVFAASRHDAAAAGFSDATIYEELVLPRDRRSLRTAQMAIGEAQAPFADWAAKVDRVGY